MDFLLSLLAIVDKYGVTISQWTCLYQALLEVSMNTITLWISVRADDRTAELSAIASNAAHLSGTKYGISDSFEVWPVCNKDAVLVASDQSVLFLDIKLT